MPVLVRRLSLLLLILGAAPAWPDAELARRFEAASPAVVTIRTVERSPTPGPGGLASYDPAGFRLLSSIYGGTHPLLQEEDAVGTRLKPLDVSNAESGKSTDEPEVEASLVSMEFDNRGCDCARKL